MGAMMRDIAWSDTPLGPVAGWPQSLRTALSMMLEARFAMVVAWGPEFRFFYNDRYVPVLGTKHPRSLGAPAAEIFPEIWELIGPEFQRVARGESFGLDDWYLPLARSGYRENCWFTVSYSPIRDETGGVGGLLAVVAETTGRVESERRLATLRELAGHAAEARTPDQAARSAVQAFARNPIDVPFAVLYAIDDDGRTARRLAHSGLSDDHPAAPAELPLIATAPAGNHPVAPPPTASAPTGDYHTGDPSADPTAGNQPVAALRTAGWPLAAVAATGVPIVLDDPNHPVSMAIKQLAEQHVATALAGGGIPDSLRRDRRGGFLRRKAPTT